MPYIKPDRRDAVRPGAADIAQNPGELNFQITELINAYIQHHGLRYKAGNEVVGVLDCAKMEFYRRIMVPYENAKLAENGDVYGG